MPQKQLEPVSGLPGSAASNTNISRWNRRVMALLGSRPLHRELYGGGTTRATCQTRTHHAGQSEVGRRAEGSKNCLKPNWSHLCQESGEPRPSLAIRMDSNAPAAPGCDPHTFSGVCASSMSRTESFVYFEPHNVSSCGMSQWRELQPALLFLHSVGLLSKYLD